MAKCDEILERMRHTLDGWGQSDFRTLYLGFGFVFVKKTKHDFYRHSKYPQLTASVARHRTLAKGYASDAVKIIDLLQRMEQEEANDEKQS